MSSAFEEIKAGLNEAISFSKKEENSVKVFKPKPVNIKKLRQKLSMTQEVFASSFGISLGTLRHWERGDRKPKGPALVLLNVVDKNPDAILNTLHG